MSCDHSKFKIIEAKKDVAGLTFRYDAKCCLVCGGVCWNEEIENQFQKWLGVQRKQNPDKFVIQKVALPSSLVDFARELALANHSTESAVYQACLALFFVLGSSKVSLAEKIDSLEPEFDGETVQKKFRVSPKLYVKIDVNAKLAELGMNEVTSWVIERVLWAAKCDIEQTRIELEYVLAV